MKKTISILLSLIMVFSVFTVIPVVSAGALDSIGYLDEDGEVQTANVITSDSTALNAGWYAVTANTEISERITCTGDVNLILCNDATLTAHKGITVSGNKNSLTIWQQAKEENKETGKLIIDQVDVNNAGIGGEESCSGNNITINGGTINVAGGWYAAGIGGGYFGVGRNITINGGSVFVNSLYGAGIGGGTYNSGEDITINGGIVIALCTESGACIGGGSSGSGENITINGGNVVAEGRGLAKGIGGGYGGDGDITLSWTNDTDSIYASSYNGTVTLEKNFSADSTVISAGELSDNGMIADKMLIPTLEVPTEPTENDPTPTEPSEYADVSYIDEDGNAKTAYSPIVITSDSTALKAGWYAVTADTVINSRVTCSGNVNLILCNDATLTAHKGITVSGNKNSLTIWQQAKEAYKETGKLIIDQVDDEAAGIGGVLMYSGNNITINGGTVNATGGRGAAGIGGGFVRDGKNITVNGGTVTATGGDSGAGIGGGSEGSGDNITINGGTVTATGGLNSAGIGGGSEGSGINITINGGTVTATGGYSGAGIGGGIFCADSGITINGGTVDAIGGDGAAGIGGGDEGSGDNITINGGTVTATGGFFGAGIGGGDEGSGDNITINGGTVDAIGGDDAAGIGGGYESSGGSITLSRTNHSDSIYASGYSGTVTLKKSFTDGTDIYYPGVVEDNNSISNKRLFSAEHFVTWKNWDGTVLKTDEDVLHGTAPVYNGAIPTKESDAQNNYTFAGWKNGTIIYDADEELPVATDDVIYTAVFVPEGYSGCASILTEPTAKFHLVYSGEPMELINAGTAKHGTMYYKLGDGEWSSQLPKATELGTYIVTYKAIGDEGYFESEEKTLTATVCDGSEEHPYLINSAADWYAFVDTVNGGNTYEGKIIKLTADIAVTRNVGDSREHIFKGTFDGDGHTVTVDITDNDAQGSALFRSIADATIRNLTVAGTVNSTQFHAAGLFGFAESGTNLIENCTVTATINGDDYAGGVYGHGIKSTVIVKNCVFSGLINGNDNATLGVFQGWSDDNTCTVDNCLYIRQNGQATNNLSYVKNVASLTVNNCYKTDSTIDNNGTLAYSITCGEGVELDLGDCTVYKNGLTAYADAKEFGGVVYAPKNATIRFAASDVGEENSIKVKKSESGKNIPVSFSGDSYSFTMPSADILVEIVPREFFSGHSITLSGDIGVNYYVGLYDKELERGATVDFLWTVDGVEKTASVNLTADDLTDNGYRATCPVAVAEMTYDVTATLTVGGEAIETNTYSVKQYGDTILSDDYKTAYLEANHTEEKYDQLALLVKTMLDYGAKAQINFNRNIRNLANKGVDYSMADVSADMITSTASDMDSGLDACGLEYAGTTIVYLSKTSMRHYYNITDQTKFDLVKDSVTFNGEKAEYKTKNGQIYFELTDIKASDLDTPYILHIGTNDYKYSVLDYVSACLNAENVPYNTMTLVSATYWYNQAANAYFG